MRRFWQEILTADARFERKATLGAVLWGLALAASLLVGSPRVAASTQPFFETHYDVIPNPAESPTIRSRASGNWENPTTWDLGRVPDSTDVVAVVTGHTVTIRTQDAMAQVLGIWDGGKVRFQQNMNTRLTVGTLLVMPGGTLEVGTETNPIAPNVTAEILIADQSLDLDSDPDQYGGGIVVVDGKITMHGAVKGATFVRVAAEPQMGGTTFSLAQAVSGWRPGDKLILPDTRQIDRFSFSPQWEELTLQSVSAGGRTVGLGALVQFNHWGARNPDGVLEFLPHVANLTRNVIIRSQNPQGTRGHVLVTSASDMDIRYALFKDMGRTTNDQLHPVTNHIGRYSLHAHHLKGPLPTPANGYQFTLIGNAIDGGSDGVSSKWGITIHDSHYGLVWRNVVYNVSGSGIVTEDGSETSNVVAENFVMRIPGTGNRLDGGRDGVGYWFRGPNNHVRDNVAANINPTGIYSYGYNFDQEYLGNIRVPNFSGADTAVAGEYTVRDGHALPLLEFARNEIYGATPNGLFYSWLGAWFGDPRAQEESVIRDLRVWHTSWLGIYHYPAYLITIDGLVVRGTGTGFTAGDYFANELVIRNADIQGAWTGVEFSSVALGPQTIENSYLRNTNNISLGPLGSVGADSSWMPPRTVFVRNVRMEAPSGQELKTIWKDPAQQIWSWAGVNLIQKDEVFVYDYDGVAGDNFKVYSWEQAPDFILPQSIPSPFNPGWTRLTASPEDGLTNLQNWHRWAWRPRQQGGGPEYRLIEAGEPAELADGWQRVALSGEVAPCGDTRPGIRGFACAGGQLPPPPPPPTATLSIAKTGAGSGTVTSEDGAISCGPTCSHTYAVNEVVTLAVKPDNHLEGFSER